MLAGCGDPKNMVAKVNKQVITRPQLDERIDSYIRSMGFDPASAEMQQQKQLLEKDALDGLIAEALLVQAAKDKGISVTDQQIMDQIKTMKTGMSEEEYQEALKAQSLTEASLKERVRINLLADALFKKVTEGVTVDPADVEKFYNDHKAELAQVKIRHILIEARDGTATQEQKDAAKAEAVGLISQLKGGADFAELAKQHSDDPGSKDNGGLYDFFFNKEESEFVTEFTDASLALAKGAITETPVHSPQFGYFIIKAEDRKDSFVQLKDSIQDDLLKNKQNQVFGDFYDQLEKGAQIVNKLADSAPAPTPAPALGTDSQGKSPVISEPPKQ